MEIASLSKSSFRIKGKQSIIIVNPAGAHDGNAALFTTNIDGLGSRFSMKDGVIIASAGEYEVGGLKIKGTTIDSHTTYSLLVDGVEILLGKLTDLEKVHSKLQEHDIVIVEIDGSIDPAFVTTLGSHAIMFVGEKAKATVESFVKENVKQMPKFVSTKEKLPQEVETILLQ